MINRVLTYNEKTLKLLSNKTATTNIAVIDVDGNCYNSITIDNQEWLIQSLRTTKYKDGTPILNLTIDASWTSNRTGAYGEYDNSAGTYAATYGYLYNWYATINSHGLAPTGWKIATFKDFDTLRTYLGGDNVAGGYLKEIGLTHWQTPNTGAVDKYGFKSVGAGVRDTNGMYLHRLANNYFWSSTSTGISSNVFSTEYSDDTFNETWGFSKNMGFSVRCMRYVKFTEVSIGTQIWSKFNYDVGGSTYPGNNLAYAADYGMLYSWQEAMNINVPGWHLPSATEFNTLINYLGGSAIAGGYLKETSTGYWSYPNSGVDNSKGFSALGAGTDGLFFKTYGQFWCNDSLDGSAWVVSLSYDSSAVTTSWKDKTSKESVRLIKNS